MAQILAGRYELVEVIGRGGMGVVHRGRDRVLDRTVAVKLLPALFAEDPTLVQRFEREARAAARLSHPNIVSIYDTGQDGTERYIVMEFVPGLSLAEVLHERGRLPVPEAVDIAAQVANAMAAAHAAGLVHRDIKPANVMVLPSGEAKVLDFGIARATADAALTRTTMVLGSAPYIAPEVALGRSADARSDIYSLGCVLYEMLTGRPPFTGELPAAVMNQHATADPQPPRELAPEIPVGLEALVLRMLAKNPDERPQEASELPSTLRASLTDPTAVTRVVPAPVPTAATQAVPARAARPAPPPPRRAAATAPAAAQSAQGSGIGARAWLVAAVLILVVAAGVAIALAASAGSGNSHSSSTSHSSTTRSSSSTPSSTSRSTPSSTTPSTTTTTTTRTQTKTTHSSTSSSTTTPTTSTSGSTTVTLP